MALLQLAPEGAQNHEPAGFFDREEPEFAAPPVHLEVPGFPFALREPGNHAPSPDFAPEKPWNDLRAPDFAVARKQMHPGPAGLIPQETGFEGPEAQ